MLNERLRAAIAAAEQFDDQTQEQLASVLEEEMAWDRTLASAKGQAILQKLVDEADRQIDTGEVGDWPSSKQ